MLFVELTPLLSIFGSGIGQTRICGACRIICLRIRTPGTLFAAARGLRKVRWAATGRGKRGGARVIYFRYVPGDRIYLILGYVKNEQDDLSTQQIKVLTDLMKDIKHG